MWIISLPKHQSDSLFDLKISSWNASNFWEDLVCFQIAIKFTAEQTKTSKLNLHCCGGYKFGIEFPKCK